MSRLRWMFAIAFVVGFCGVMWWAALHVEPALALGVLRFFGRMAAAIACVHAILTRRYYWAAVHAAFFGGFL